VNKIHYYTRFCFFTFLFLYSYNAKSQEGTINYKLTINDKILGKKRDQNIVLYFNNSKSIELIVKPQNIVIDNKVDELNQVKVIKVTKPYFIFKDFSKKMLTLSDYVGTKKILITDTLNNFKWGITNEKKKIGNFNCKKATVSFRGRFYEAWYAEEIPLRNGPWKFCGLPGLIIKIRDNNSDFVYELIGINLKAKFDSKLISVPSSYLKDKKNNYSEFRSLYKKQLEDNLKFSRVGQIMPDGTSATVNITLPEKMEKF
jgi:GLPGLI family protein